MSFLAWEAHLDNCPACRLAVRGRFTGQSPEQMRGQCCGEGGSLYYSFVQECREKEEGMDTIARRPAAYLFPDGAAVFTDDLGRPIHDLQALNWRGLHEFLRLYPDAEVCLRGESCLTGDCLLSFLSNIALPEMAGVEDEKEGG